MHCPGYMGKRDSRERPGEKHILRKNILTTNYPKAKMTYYRLRPKAVILPSQLKIYKGLN